MKISVYLGAILLAFFIKTVTSHVRIQRTPQQYCGSKLADIMKFLCATKYHYPDPVTQKPKKRNEIDAYAWNYSDLADDDYNELDYPHRSKLQNAYYFMESSPSFKNARSKRHQPRIVDECCHKPCYISELRSYCSV